MSNLKRLLQLLESYGRFAVDNTFIFALLGPPLFEESDNNPKLINCLSIQLSSSYACCNTLQLDAYLRLRITHGIHLCAHLFPIKQVKFNVSLVATEDNYW